MNKTIKIKEIFASVQGEGPYVGEKQIFIRFCGCNLKCKYCDTDFSDTHNFYEYTSNQLIDALKQFDLNTVSSISLTGGEPLLSADFLSDFLPCAKRLGLKIYLETNAVLYNEIKKIINYTDIISADIKLESCSGQNLLKLHDKFFTECRNKNLFAKAVFDNNITDAEIEACAALAKKYRFTLILQPKMENDSMSVSSEFCTEILEKFLQLHKNTRLIPQVHKFINVR